MLPLQLGRQALHRAKAISALSRSYLKGNYFCTTSCLAAKEKKTLAICREEGNVFESRAALSPAQVQALTREGTKVRDRTKGNELTRVRGCSSYIQDTISMQRHCVSPEYIVGNQKLYTQITGSTIR